MQPLRQLVRVDLLADPLAALICGVISYYAYKAHRLSQQRSFLLMFYAFVALAVGFTTHFVSILFGVLALEGGGRPPQIRLLATNVTMVGGWLYVLSQIAGYLLLIAAYTTNPGATDKGETVFLQIPFILRPLHGPFFDIIIFVLALVVFIEAAQKHVEAGTAEGYPVTIAFLLLALSRLLLPLATFEDSFYALGQFMQIASFLVFLATIGGIKRR